MFFTAGFCLANRRQAHRQTWPNSAIYTEVVELRLALIALSKGFIDAVRPET